MYCAYYTPHPIDFASKMTKPAAAHPKKQGAAASARRVSRSSEADSPRRAPVDGVVLDPDLVFVREDDSGARGRSRSRRLGLGGGLALGGGGLGGRAHCIISRGRDRSSSGHTKVLIRLRYIGVNRIFYPET